MYSHRPFTADTDRTRRTLTSRPHELLTATPVCGRQPRHPLVAEPEAMKSYREILGDLKRGHAHCCPSSNRDKQKN